MNLEIQKLLYEKLNECKLYPVYTAFDNTFKQPYILLHNISISPLLYSQELYQYNAISATITIINKSLSNKNSLEALDIIYSKLKQLKVENLSIETHIDNYQSKAAIAITFTYISIL